MKYLAIITLALFLFACENQGRKKEVVIESPEAQVTKEVKNVNFTGVVLNAQDSTPVSMAMIMVPGTTTGTMSGPDGKFMISGPESTKKLTFAMQGFEGAKLDVTVGEDNTIYLTPKN